VATTVADTGIKGKRSLSGIQPTGAPHIGNYFGAIKQYVDLHHENEGFYFVANYHALTSLRDPQAMTKQSMDVALDLLACGLDPGKATIFLQSDIPEVMELTWMLSCVTPMGLLERCHAYKDKVAQGLYADHGLFAYPVLMAADILVYDSDVVPVGQDQKQHLEVTRDIASRFNHAFGDVLKLPEPFILPQVAIVPGLDGRKMSKSYDNTIGIFEPDAEIKKKIMRIKTDSTPVEDPKDPDACPVFQLYSLLASPDEAEALATRYCEGGVGYGEVKKETVRLFHEYFGAMREKRKELEGQPGFVCDVLRDGAKRAREKAKQVTERAREACGMPRP
jgi:tryptophanyl-tRNA synthetase